MWHVMTGAVILGVTAALYGLHRLCLWLEERGWLFYLHKKPSSSPASCFAAMQQALEPQIKHVACIKEERQQAKAEAPGDDATSDSDQRGTP